MAGLTWAKGGSRHRPLRPRRIDPTGPFYGLWGIVASPPLPDLLASPRPVRLSGELLADTLVSVVCRMERQLFPLFSIFSSLTFCYKVLTIRIVTKARDRAELMLLLGRAVTWGNCKGEARVSLPKTGQFFYRVFVFPSSPVRTDRTIESLRAGREVTTMARIKYSNSQ
jgi:hypothetical protein